MTSEQETVLLIKGAISELSADQAEAFKACIDAIHSAIKSAGEPMGTLALALVGAERASLID